MYGLVPGSDAEIMAHFEFGPTKPLSPEEIEPLQKAGCWLLAIVAFATSPMIMNDAIQNDTSPSSELYTNGLFMVGLILGIAALGFVIWQACGMMKSGTEKVVSNSPDSIPLTLGNPSINGDPNKEMQPLGSYREVPPQRSPGLHNPVTDF